MSYASRLCAARPGAKLASCAAQCTFTRCVSPSPSLSNVAWAQKTRQIRSEWLPKSRKHVRSSQNRTQNLGN
eukprot:2869240-Rhodomonas_salina.2